MFRRSPSYRSRFDRANGTARAAPRAHAGARASRRVARWSNVGGKSFLAVWLAVCGCMSPKSKITFNKDVDMEHYKSVALDIEYPDVCLPDDYLTPEAPPPVTIASDAPVEFWDLKLEDAVRTGLENARVLRDLGAVVLQNPSVLRTVQTPALTETDPRFGVEAALSDFDARFTTSAIFEKNDRALNNAFFGGGTRLFDQDLGVYKSELTKKTAVGTDLTVRHNTEYDANNAPANLFPSAWNTNYEIEARQPLLQGAGVDFNRIAGPNSALGIYNGVLIARVNTDISLADFELGVRNMVSNVENAYWDLYFAYRDLDAKIAARDSSLETWRRVHALFEAGRRGGEAEKEAEAREQYFRFTEEVENALTGQLLEGTRTFNGSSGGTLRGIPGVHVAERRLRWLMGIPITDGRLIRPADEPIVANVLFDWNESVIEAFSRRPELRRQRWVVKRRELELSASRNYMLARLDTVGRYRWRGFGHDLIDPNGNNLGPFDNAYDDLVSGRFQEWQLGVELDVPLGFRRANSAVRNAQLNLARERAILQEQERSIVHDLSNAVADKERAYLLIQTNYNRRGAASEHLSAIEAAFEADQAQLEFVLEAQRRLADSQSRYFRAMVEYAIAIRNVHFEKGSLLDFHEVHLSESPWPEKAYHDAREKVYTERGPALSYILRQKPPSISQGTIPTNVVVPDTHLHATSPEAEAVPQGSIFEMLPPPVAEPSATQPVPLPPIELPKP